MRKGAQVGLRAMDSVLQHSHATGTERLILLILARYAGDDYETYCGYTRLSDEANISERNVVYTLKKLEASGEIKIERGSGRGMKTIYKINLPEVKKAQPAASIPESRQAKRAAFPGADNQQPPAPFSVNQENEGDSERMQAAAPYQTHQNMQAAAPFSSESGEAKGCKLETERVQDSEKRVQTEGEKGAKPSDAYIERESNKESIKESKEQPPPKRRKSVGQFFNENITTVLSYWANATGNQTAVFDQKRKKLVEFRLLDGFTVEQLCLAVDGCLLSEFHSGQNKGGFVYDQVKHIFADADSVESFMRHAKNGKQNGHHRPDKSEQNQLAADEAEKRIFGNSANFDADAEVIPE